MTEKKNPETLRSARWFAPDDLRAFGHRSRAMQMGYAPEEWKDRPVIAILNTWSDAQPCHMHFKSRVDDVKRGILMAGGFPMELPALSLSESFLKPTTMLYRNLLAMDAEELLRGHPVDGVVLMGGCDKTTPALLLGATSMGLPAIYLPAGPMLRGNWKGKTLGSGSDAWKYWDERRAGKISDKDWVDVEAGIARSYGTCMTMGTASTMTAIAESIGMTLPGASSIPAADAGHIRMSSESGRRIVEMVWEDLTPKKIQTRNAYLNGSWIDGDGLPDAAHADRRAVGDEQQLVAAAFAVGRRAGDVVHLLGGKIASLAAEAGRGLLGRDRQAVDLGPVLGVEQHAVDRQLVGIVVGALAVFAGERHDVVLVAGVVDGDREIDPALVVMGEGHGLAGKGAARDLQRLAMAGHQRQQVDEGRLLRRRIVHRDRGGRLGKTRACESYEGCSQDRSAEAHRQAHMPEATDGQIPPNNHRTANWLRSRLLRPARLEYHRATLRRFVQIAPPVLAGTCRQAHVFFVAELANRRLPAPITQGRAAMQAGIEQVRARGSSPLRIRATMNVSSISSRWAWLPPMRTTSARTGASVCTQAA